MSLETLGCGDSRTSEKLENHQSSTLKKKLRWYPQQLQRFILQIFLKGAGSQALETLVNLLNLWEIAWGELRWEGARWKRRQGGRRGNHGK
jgi:hypothetical protein